MSRLGGTSAAAAAAACARRREAAAEQPVLRRAQELHLLVLAGKMSWEQLKARLYDEFGRPASAPGLPLRPLRPINQSLRCKGGWERGQFETDFWGRGDTTEQRGMSVAGAIRSRRRAIVSPPLPLSLPHGSPRAIDSMSTGCASRKAPPPPVDACPRRFGLA